MLQKHSNFEHTQPGDVMLVIERRDGESMKIFPARSVDPNMTVQELFADGPILIKIQTRNPKRAKIVIDAPAALMVARSELVE